MSAPKDNYTLEEIFHYKDKTDEVKKIDISEVRKLSTIKFDNTTLKSDIAILKENIKRYEKYIEELHNQANNTTNTTADHRQGDWPPRIDPLNHSLRIPPSVSLTSPASRSLGWRDYGSCFDYLQSLTRHLRNIHSVFSGSSGCHHSPQRTPQYSPASPPATADPRLSARRGGLVYSTTATLNNPELPRTTMHNNRHDTMVRERFYSSNLRVPLPNLSFKDFEELMNQKNTLLTMKEDLKSDLKKVKQKFEAERIKLCQQQQQRHQTPPTPSQQPAAACPLIQLEYAVAEVSSTQSSDSEEEEEEEWAQINEEDKDNWEDISSSVEENFI